MKCFHCHRKAKGRGLLSTWGVSGAGPSQAGLSWEPPFDLTPLHPQVWFVCVLMPSQRVKHSQPQLAMLVGAVQFLLGLAPGDSALLKGRSLGCLVPRSQQCLGFEIGNVYIAYLHTAY